MKINLKKTISLCVALVLAMSTASCGKKSGSQNQSQELTYWVPFGNQAVTGVTNFAELPVYKEVLNRTGLNVVFKHPANGQMNEQLNLLLASGDLPDIIQYPFSTDYPGGAAKAIEQGCIQTIDINKAPNLKKYLKEHPEVDKQIKTDNGEYYTFPCIYGDDNLLVFTGIIVRYDLLKKMNVEMPETIDEWYNVLTKAKKELGLKSPITLSYGNLAFFAQAYGICSGIYVDNGVIKYGEYEQKYAEFLKEMAKWYKEGLMDQKIASMDTKIIKQNIINGDTLAAVGNIGGGIGAWTTALEGTDAELQPAPYPVLNKGDKPYSGHRINEYSAFGSVCISAKCKNLDAAYKLLDFGYSDEGRMLFNFGIEGESYEMIDGYPTYTELITKNPDGKSMSDMLGIYACPDGVSPTIKDARYMEQFAALPAQKKALELWMNTNAKEHLLPPVSFTPEESSEISKLKTEINSYIDQTVLKFITGVEPIENFDQYISNLGTIGADRLVELYQQAYDRYQKR